MSIRPVGGGGGGGFTLGPATNVFTGVTKAAAELARDNYAASEAGWIDDYNADTNLNIRLEYDNASFEPTVEYQVRNSAGTEWLTNSSAIGVRGRDGESADLTGVRANHVPVKNALGKFADSGIEIREDGTVVIPESTLGIGDLIELSEGTGFGVIHNNESGLSYVLLDALLSDQTGSARPRQFVISTPDNVNFEAGGTDTLTDNPLTFTRSLTSTGSTFNLTFTATSTMTNAKMRITDEDTGVVFKHVPSRISWEVDSEPGYNLRAGTNTINFFSKNDDDPANGVFNFGISPLIFVAGRTIRVEIKADNVSLIGDSATNTPNFSGRFGLGNFRNIAYQDDQPASVQSDWNVDSTSDQSYIKNKPNLVEYKSEIGVTALESPYNASLNIPFNVDLSDGNVTVVFPDGNDESDLMYISAILNIGGNLLILESSNFDVYDKEGALLGTDTNLHISENKPYKFYWTGARWRYYIN